MSNRFSRPGSKKAAAAAADAADAELSKAREALVSAQQSPEVILSVAEDVDVCFLPDRAAAEKVVTNANLNPDVLRQNKEHVRRLLSTQRMPTGRERAIAESLAVEPPPLSKQERKALGSQNLEERWSGVGNLEAKEVLSAVRQRAENWRTGTAGVLGLITAALVVSGTGGTAQLFTSFRVRGVLAVLLVLSAGLGLVSLRFAIRAANGPSWLDTKIKEAVATPLPTSTRDLIRARAAAKDLGLAQLLLWLAIGAFVVLVACLWALPHSLLK